MDTDKNYILEVKSKLDDTSWNFERKEIIQKAVAELRRNGYSDAEIKKLFQIGMIKEQDNTQMVSNNARYLELLAEILNS
ncbi:hypothetical protein [Rufibacter immobilis]|uniref:hypothetical protein n=1 Tax=Rufibacter immobilis TaxID=1348778 RepID=UPI0035E5A891